MRRLSVLGAFAALVCAGGANAATVPGTGGFVTIGNDLTSAADLGRMWQKAEGLGAKGYMPANITMSNAANGIRVAGSATATIGGRTVPLTLISRLPVATVAQAARGVAMLNPASAAVTILGFAAMSGWLTPAGLEWNRDPATNVTHPFVRQKEQLQCSSPDQAWNNPAAWCQSAYGAPSGSVEVLDSDNGLGVCRYRVNCGSGAYSPVLYAALNGVTTAPELRTLDQGIADLSAAPSASLQGVDWKSITQQLLDLGAKFPEDALKDGQVSGPASQPGSRTETVGKRNPSDPASETVKTTTTTTHNYTYNNTTVNYNTTVRTEVRDENGNLLEESDADKDDPEQVAQDTDLPQIPDFYGQKYADGFKGVWSKNSAAFQATSLGTFALKLMPSGLGAGSCPQWSITLDVGIFDGGMHDVSVPCEIWQACKVLVLLGALLLARRLVFGG